LEASIDTLGALESPPLRGKISLYDRAGFPQAVQGNPGENNGESVYYTKWLFFIALQ